MALSVKRLSASSSPGGLNGRHANIVRGVALLVTITVKPFAAIYMMLSRVHDVTKTDRSTYISDGLPVLVDELKLLRRAALDES